MQVLEHLLGHVIHRVLAFLDLEKLSQLIAGLSVRVKIHFGLSLQFFPSFVFFLAPVHLLLVLEEGWLVLLNLLLFASFLLVKFVLGLSVLLYLLLEKVEVAESRLLETVLLQIGVGGETILAVALLGSELWFRLGFGLALLLGFGSFLVFAEVWDLWLVLGVVLHLDSGILFKCHKANLRVSFQRL